MAQTKIMLILIIATAIPTISLLQSPVAVAQDSRTVSSQSNEGILYTDPAGRFTLYYPSDWIVMDSEDDTYDAIFKQPNQKLGTLDIRITEDMPNIPIEELFDYMISRYPEKIPNYMKTGDSNCETYRVDGEKACHIFYKRETDNTEYSVFQVITPAYAFTYGTDKPLPPSELDNDFFQVLQMIASFSRGVSS